MERTRISKAVAWAILSSSVAVTGVAYSADNTKSTPSATERGAQSRDDRSRPQRQATQQQGDRFWASDLIGKNVALSGGRDGEIKDVIVNTQTGEVRHIVAEIDTDKAKERLYAVPARMFQLGADNKLTLNVDQSWLAQRKSWSNDKWPTMQDPGYWGDERAPAAGAPSAAGGAKDKTAASPAAGGDAAAHRLSKLIGQDVHDAKGKEVGEIDDAVVNLKSQKVDFVLFSHDPGVTQAEKQYAVAMGSFKFPAATADGGDSKQRIVLNLSEDKIKGMKPLERADKKRINDPAFMSRFESK